MAFFKFRKGGDEHPTPAPAPESVEAMRKRARHRLIGAVILVMVGVIGFPMLFDNQPRPIAVDIPIEIPDKAKVKPLTAVAPAAPEEKTLAPAAKVASAPAAAAPAPVSTPTATGSRAVSGAVSGAVSSAAKPEPKPETKPEPVDDGAKAKALLEGKEADKKPATVAPAAAVAPTGRFIVQVGAFADVLKAREARQKLEKAGLKTYTQVVQSTEGRRIRVRVGPFEGKAEADKAAEKIKKLDLPAAILEL
jgi:DedD protein